MRRSFSTHELEVELPYAHARPFLIASHPQSNEAAVVVSFLAAPSRSRSSRDSRGHRKGHPAAMTEQGKAKHANRASGVLAEEPASPPFRSTLRRMERLRRNKSKGLRSYRIHVVRNDGKIFCTITSDKQYDNIFFVINAMTAWHTFSAAVSSC